MDVVYVGVQVLTESEVKQLLGYQYVINRHINWDKTRAEASRDSCHMLPTDTVAAVPSCAVAV